MQLVKEASVEQINAAFLALQNEIEALKRKGTATITIKVGELTGSFVLDATSDKTVELTASNSRR